MKLTPRDVPVFILAGGMGTRFSEETQIKPKPMIEVGGLPILLHIMKTYYSYGFNDFVICAGYRSLDIKKFFLNYDVSQNHLEVDARQEGAPVTKVLPAHGGHERWRVRVIDTGLETMTGARLALAMDLVAQNQKIETLALTYGDGLTNADLGAELAFHKSHGRLGTVLGVKNLARYGELDVTPDAQVEGFLEKPEERQGHINGGFFFFDSGFRKYLGVQPDLILEREPLGRLAADGQLMMYRHDGFWQAMDTRRDWRRLQDLWESGNAPWAIWKKV